MAGIRLIVNNQEFKLLIPDTVLRSTKCENLWGKTGGQDFIFFSKFD